MCKRRLHLSSSCNTKFNNNNKKKTSFKKTQKKLNSWTKFHSIIGGGASSVTETYHQVTATTPFLNFQLSLFQLSLFLFIWKPWICWLWSLFLRNGCRKTTVRTCNKLHVVCETHLEWKSFTLKLNLPNTNHQINVLFHASHKCMFISTSLAAPWGRSALPSSAGLAVDPALLIRLCWSGSVDLALFSSQCRFPSHYPAAHHRSGSAVTVWGHGFHSSLTLRDPGWTGAAIRSLSLPSQTWINTRTSSRVTLTQTISNSKLKSSPNHN